MKITIGSDHGAVGLKDAVKKILQEMNVEINDIGTFGSEAVDYHEGEADASTLYNFLKEKVSLSKGE